MTRCYDKFRHCSIPSYTKILKHDIFRRKYLMKKDMFFQILSVHKQKYTHCIHQWLTVRDSRKGRTVNQ
jgi:hypothetical protein